MFQVLSVLPPLRCAVWNLPEVAEGGRSTVRKGKQAQSVATESLACLGVKCRKENNCMIMRTPSPRFLANGSGILYIYNFSIYLQL